MKNMPRIGRTAWVFAGAMFYLAASLAAGEVALGKGSALWLEGDSTLHPFSSTATVVRVSGEWAGDLKVRDFSLAVPVEGLKSEKSGLDKNLQKTLNAKAHPDIFFRLKTLNVAENLSVSAVGTLSISGVEREVELAATASREDGSVRVRGRQDVRMTDFGIKPPSLMLGAIKVKDKVTVFYDIVMVSHE